MHLTTEFWGIGAAAMPRRTDFSGTAASTSPNNMKIAYFDWFGPARGVTG